VTDNPLKPVNEDGDLLGTGAGACCCLAAFGRSLRIIRVIRVIRAIRAIRVIITVDRVNRVARIDRVTGLLRC
jgi:hypothetical protein